MPELRIDPMLAYDAYVASRGRQPGYPLNRLTFGGKALAKYGILNQRTRLPGNGGR